MGLVSASSVGCLTFGMGVMCESFHIFGTVPDESDILKIFATGSAKRCANSFKRRLGILSGPHVFRGINDQEFLTDFVRFDIRHLINSG